MEHFCRSNHELQNISSKVWQQLLGEGGMAEFAYEELNMPTQDLQGVKELKLSGTFFPLIKIFQFLCFL